MDYDLKTCPFCGGTASTDFEINDPDNVEWIEYEVYCDDCFVSVKSPDIKTSTDNWNKRIKDEK